MQFDFTIKTHPENPSFGKRRASLTNSYQPRGTVTNDIALTCNDRQAVHDSAKLMMSCVPTKRNGKSKTPPEWQLSRIPETVDSLTSIGGFLSHGDTPKSSISIRFSIINHKPTILGYPFMETTNSSHWRRTSTRKSDLERKSTAVPNGSTIFGPSSQSQKNQSSTVRYSKNQTLKPKQLRTRYMWADIQRAKVAQGSERASGAHVARVGFTHQALQVWKGFYLTHSWQSWGWFKV